MRQMISGLSSGVPVPSPVRLASPRSTVLSVSPIQKAPASPSRAAMSTQPATASQRLDDAIEEKAKQVKALEQLADDAHKAAQALNKEGRFAEAQAAYARMHKLEDEASILAKEVGCVACVLGDPSCTGGDVAMDASEVAAYLEHHPVPPLPSDLPLDPTTLRSRWVGTVLGSLVGDAAGMGVHWVYDLDLMAKLAAEVADSPSSLQGHQPSTGVPDAGASTGAIAIGRAADTTASGGTGAANGVAVAGLAQEGETSTSGAAHHRGLYTIGSEADVPSMKRLNLEEEREGSAGHRRPLIPSSLSYDVRFPEAPTADGGGATKESSAHGGTWVADGTATTMSPMEEAPLPTDTTTSTTPSLTTVTATTTTTTTTTTEKTLTVTTVVGANAGASTGANEGDALQTRRVEVVKSSSETVITGTVTLTRGLEFMDPPRSPFYTYPTGRNSPYGEQTLVLLRSLAASKGLDCCDYAYRFASYFGDDGGFDGYRDVSTKGFLRNFDRGMAPPSTGAPDAQANCIARLAPLVAGWAGSADMLPSVRRATRVTQNSDAACAWAGAGAAVLEKVVLGAAPSDAVKEVIRELKLESEVQEGAVPGRPQAGPLALEIASQLEKALSLAATPVPLAVAELGRNCHMPNALTSPLHVVLHMEHLTLSELSSSSSSSSSLPLTCDPGCGDGAMAQGNQQQGDVMTPLMSKELARRLGSKYAEAVQAAIREGGCCSSRASYVGALMGAVSGLEGIPSAWRAKYSVSEEVRAAAETLFDSRLAASRATS